MKRAQRLVFKPQWMAQKTSTGDFLLSSEVDTRLIQGDVFGRIVPLIDGQHTQEGIAHLLRGALTASEVRAAIQSLEAAGLLAEPGSLPAREEAFWNLLVANPEEVAKRLQEKSVEVLATAG